MDSGWAVILGAIIALTGSSLLPWWRETLAERRQSAADAARRRSDAIVELLARNAGVSMSGALRDAARIQATYEARQRAMIRLLLEVPGDERKDMARLLKNSVPIVTDTAKGIPGHMTSALQDVILAWAAGELPASDLYPRYSKLAKPPEDPKKS